jgi:arsenate reductase
MMEYWHNPRCSKSRAGKELLDSAGVTYDERRYLDEPPSAQELDEVLKALDKEPWDIARMGEGVANDLGLSSLPHDRAKWIEIMVANPILIERPILVTEDGRAAIGRPTEALQPLL